MITALKNAGIATTLAYEAKFINKKIIGITQYAEKVNSEFDFEGILVKKSKIDFTPEIVEKVYEYLHSEQKYIIDEVGNVLELDPTGAVRTALEIMEYQLDHAWYAWGTKTPSIVSGHITEQIKLEIINDLADTFKLSIVELSDALYSDPNVLDNTFIKYKLIKKQNLPNFVLEMMYNIYMSDFSYNIKRDALLKCYDYLKDLGYNSEKIGWTLLEITDFNLYIKLTGIVEDLSMFLSPRSVEDYYARKWYEKIDEKIIEIIDNKFPELKFLYKDRAKIAFHLRNLLRMKSRLSMKNVKNVEYLMKRRAFETWIFFIKKYSNQRYEGIDLWKKITESATRASEIYSNYLGIKK